MYRHAAGKRLSYGHKKQAVKLWCELWNLVSEICEQTETEDIEASSSRYLALLLTTAST